MNKVTIKEGLKAWEQYAASLKGLTEKSKTLGELKYMHEKKKRPTAVYVFFSKLIAALNVIGIGNILVLILTLLYALLAFIKIVLPHLRSVN